ncbi:MAG: hypothetical protein E7253_00945 [Lachnospiraceae bacterium]|nr:hypothetical protein [Lachnospiraceae bacterium]
MEIRWHVITKEGFPKEAGRYLVTIEGMIEGMKPEPGERCVTTARYYGSEDWGIRDGIYKVVAWAELPEVYWG